MNTHAVDLRSVATAQRSTKKILSSAGGKQSLIFKHAGINLDEEELERPPAGCRPLSSSQAAVGPDSDNT